MPRPHPPAAQDGATNVTTEYQVVRLPLTALHVDREHYQRPFQEHRVRRMLAEFDSRLVGVLVVSRRKDGRDYVIDGQQRLATIRRRGYTHATRQVYEGLTLAQEAAMFARLDTDRVKLRTTDAFRARLTANDEAAVRVAATITQAGWQLGLTGAARGNAVADTVTSVDACERIDERWGSVVLAETLRVLRPWARHRTGAKRELLLGVALLLARYRDAGITVDEGRLTAAVGVSHPDEVLADARTLGRALGSRVATAVATNLMTIYNRLERAKRLPPFGTLPQPRRRPAKRAPRSDGAPS